MQHYHESVPCTVSKDKWDTKKDTGKSVKHTLYVLQAEATSNSEKIKPILSYACLNRSVEIPLNIFCSNLLEAFQVILKALMGLTNTAKVHEVL